MAGQPWADRLLATIMLGLLALSGGAPVHAQESVLRVVPYADLRNTDPIWTTATITQHHGYMIYDTLFARDENFELQPQMVDEWEVSDDGLTYTFTLRDGLLFHDGTPVESKDVTASLKRWAVRDTMGQALMKVTASIEPVDAKTFKLVLTEPYGLVIDSLGKSVSNVPFIMQEEAAQTDPFEQVDSFIGSGPFRFVEEEWVPGNKVVYEKFEDYVPRDEPPSALAGGKVAKVDRVEWFYIPDPATAMGALQNNEVDFYEAPPVDLVPALEANPDVAVGVQNPYGLVVMLRPNHLYPPFDKAEARRALSYMVDQEEYMTAMVGNPEYFQTCASMLMCGTPYAVTTGGGERMVEGDMAKAKELMDQVYQDETVVVMHPTDHPSGPTALVTAAKLRELGVNVELQAMDWSTLTSRRTSKNPPTEGGWSLFITRTGISAATPVGHLGVAASGENAWFGWPDNETIEKLRLDFATESDHEKRLAIMEDLQEELMEYQPYVVVGQYTMPSAWRSNVKGLLEAPALAFWNVSVE
jgi:peptide/nickel transport system substrate-binding protein